MRNRRTKHRQDTRGSRYMNVLCELYYYSHGKACKSVYWKAGQHKFKQNTEILTCFFMSQWENRHYLWPPCIGREFVSEGLCEEVQSTQHKSQQPMCTSDTTHNIQKTCSQILQSCAGSSCPWVVFSWSHVNRHVSLSESESPFRPELGPSRLQCWLLKDEAGDRLDLIRSGRCCTRPLVNREMFRLCGRVWYHSSPVSALNIRFMRCEEKLQHCSCFFYAACCFLGELVVM